MPSLASTRLSESPTALAELSRPGSASRLAAPSFSQGTASELKVSPRAPISVFNYEGGDRSGSRNQLHMLTNHSLMNAQLSSREGHDPQRKVKKRKKITVNLQGTRYDIVREVCENLGYTIAKDDDQSAYLLWNDTYVASERISEMKSFQRINHFPGMGEICRKDCLARNMAKMQKVHPEEFNFVPQSWILPAEYPGLQAHAKDMKKKKKGTVYIAKPPNGAMGQGIVLFTNAEKIPSSENFVVQEYIEKPFLIEGFKCDLRIYVLISSCDPMKLFLFHDGLVRMSTEKYKEPTPQNLDVLFMHLTNYSINKHSETYEKGNSIDTGSKRSLKFLNSYLRHNEMDVVGLWANITDVIIKTMITALPHVYHGYKMCRPGQPPYSDSVCFEILGFDIMLDRKLKPWLLEVNRSPSFSTNEQIDYDIKSSLLADSLGLVNIRASDKKKNIAAQKAAAQRRLLQPRGRLDEFDEKKKGLVVDKRKEELKDLLARIRKDNAKTSFEDRNLGGFRRIFPSDDQYKQEKYAQLIASSFTNLVMGKNGTMVKEIERHYHKKFREDEVLDMLAQYEAEEDVKVNVRRQRGPPPLTAMPSSAAESQKAANDEDNEGYSEEDTDSEEFDENLQRPRAPSKLNSKSPLNGQQLVSLSRPQSGVKPLSRPTSSVKHRQSSPAGIAREHLLTLSLTAETAAMNKAIKEKEEELTRIVLSALQDMKIKFPGKTDEEADFNQQQLLENWKIHKPRVASYWLVKLDSIKRRKVVDIVRTNVRSKVQHIYQTHDVEALRLFRIFNRVFNRLLWSHGQGLWNCFTQPGNSWETCFSKSTDVISNSEMECSRRIVQLCKDCLLIVYQFAAEAKTRQETESETNGVEQADTQTGVMYSSWRPDVSVSQRYSRLYSRPTYHKLHS